MNKKITILVVAAVLSAVMLACSFPVIQAQLRQEDIQSISDSVIQTLASSNLLYQQPILSNEDLIATEVAKAVSGLAVPTPTPIPYVAPTATPHPCYAAIMLSETVPDYTNFSLGQAFTKSWRLKNVGTCNWNTGFRLAFYSGNSMSGPAYVNLPYSVAPGGSVDINVPLVAPTTAGTYTGYWALYTDANRYIGKVWVTITAGPTTSTSFAVTSVSYAIDFVSQDIGLCGVPTDVTFNIQANITTNGAGIVTYYWEKSDLTHTATQTLTYGGASTQTVLLTHTITGAVAAGDYWVKIYIDNPNHQLFSPINFHITCT